MEHVEHLSLINWCTLIAIVHIIYYSSTEVYKVCRRVYRERQATK